MDCRFNQRVPMRDGVSLSADVYAPDGPGPFPVLLCRTPYNKNAERAAERARGWAKRGWAFVWMDVRGRGDSDGDFFPYRAEGADGFDSVEWLAAQPWSTGEVATFGGSYSGFIQWLTALQSPPHLRAMVVHVPHSDPFVEWPTGTLDPMMICWYRMVDGRLTQHVAGTDWMRVYEHLPLIDMDQRAGFSSPAWRAAQEHPLLDEWWEPLRYQHRLGQLDLPVLHISGWYDDEQVGTPRNFAGMRAQARGERARSGQRLVMGPWPHQVNSTRKLGEVDFGPEAVIDLDALEARWLEHWALGRDNGAQDDAPVRIFVMGGGGWRDERAWPLERTRWVDLHLHSGGNANSRFGDGTLSATPPADEPPDRLRHDPSRPVPFLTDPLSNQIGGPDDYAAVEQRADVLCYSTPPLSADVEVTGPVRLELFAASSAPDTDFMAKLVDVHPGGFCQRLCDGMVRARYRFGMDRAELLEPGRAERFEVDLWHTAHIFRAGHRIRLEVASSAFPKYDRNLGNGEPLANSTRIVVADNDVLHDAAHPSHLVLPVVDGPLA